MAHSRAHAGRKEVSERLENYRECWRLIFLCVPEGTPCYAISAVRGITWILFICGIKGLFLTLLRKTMVYPVPCSYISFSGILLLADGLSKVFKTIKHPALPQLSWVMRTRLLHCEYLEIPTGILSVFPLLCSAAVSIPSRSRGCSHIPLLFTDIWNE